MRSRQPLKTFICPTCKRTFKDRHGNRKYCSPACHYKSRTPRERKQKYCLACGREIENRWNNKFCSRECFNQVPRKSKPNKKTICIFCGKEFLASRKTRKFCSTSCQMKFNRLKHHPPKERICSFCGSHFFGKTTSKYCYECRGKYSKIQWVKNKDNPEQKKHHSLASIKYQQKYPEKQLAQRIALRKFKKEINGGYKSHSKYSHQPLIVLYECPHDHPRKHNHHPDYRFPLRVYRLCPQCHTAEHKRLRQHHPLEAAAS